MKLTHVAFDTSVLPLDSRFSRISVMLRTSTGHVGDCKRRYAEQTFGHATSCRNCIPGAV